MLNFGITHEATTTDLTKQLLDFAIEKNVSDIHFEAFEQSCRVRVRQDGLLNQIAEIEILQAKRIISSLKIMAKVDIAEKRLPQDGHIVYKEFDIRLSTCPTLFGEKIVLRILNSENKLLNISDLGLTPSQHEIFIHSLDKPRGMILVTGATGSGKTVTLYSALKYLNIIEKNISTIEDPVEIRLPGINQTNIHAKLGFGFATALKTFLRQDPDIIMLGEIRDAETAKIAMQAAETGHLVLSTLHTDSAIEALFRLFSFGISYIEIANSVSLIVAQRLIRKLCKLCNGNYSECTGCNLGFKGRTGLFECLKMDLEIVKLLEQKRNIFEIEEYAIKTGFKSLKQIALEKIKQGITTSAEIKRVLC